MQVSFESIQIAKRVPLTISRGTVGRSTVFWLRLEAEGIEGWGEASPFSIGSHEQSAEKIATELKQVSQMLTQFHPLQMQTIEFQLKSAGLGSAVCAAVDTALHDWLGKRAGLPLWQLLGLELMSRPTSVTIGIGTPDQAQKRLQDWLQQVEIKAVKVKLGSPDGIAADQAMFDALLQHLPEAVGVSVDANGGWSLADATQMATWLAERGVTYLEQPLPVAADEVLPDLYLQSPLPIFVDESCFTCHDIPRLAPWVDGINIKLMKCGGLREAMRMIHVAQTHELKVMFGCYSNTTLGNTAMAHLSPLAHHLDLDSHLNLKNDPFSGAEIINGVLMPNHLPGLGLAHHVA